MTPAAPRIVNEISYVMIKQASHFVVRRSTGLVLCSTE